MAGAMRVSLRLVMILIASRWAFGLDAVTGPTTKAGRSYGYFVRVLNDKEDGEEVITAVVVKNRETKRLETFLLPRHFPAKKLRQILRKVKAMKPDDRSVVDWWEQAEKLWLLSIRRARTRPPTAPTRTAD